MTIRFASISDRMSRSERSTPTTYPAARARGPGPTMATMNFTRYVAIGDSFTEGVGDPDESRPNGWRGWADRVAEVPRLLSRSFASLTGRAFPPETTEPSEPAEPTEASEAT